MQISGGNKPFKNKVIVNRQTDRQTQWHTGHKKW